MSRMKRHLRIQELLTSDPGNATGKSIDGDNRESPAKKEEETGHNTFEMAPTFPTNASPRVLQPSRERDIHNTHPLRRSSRQRTYEQLKTRKLTAPEPAIATPPSRKRMESQREQDAKDRARRKQLIDAGVEKLTAEYMEKAGGDLMKAAGFWFEREAKKKRQPWQGLEEGEAFIENMKKDILDPLQLQREMQEEEEEEAANRKRLSNRRLARARGLGGSKMAPGASSVESERQACAIEQAHHMPETQQPASSTAIDLTAPTKPVSNPEPPSAASSKQPAPSTTLQSAEMLSMPSTSASPPPPPPVHSSSERKGKRRKTETKKLSDLWGEWSVSVTETGHRPCAKRRRQNGPE